LTVSDTSGALNAPLAVEHIERPGGRVLRFALRGRTALNLVGSDCMRNAAAQLRELAADQALRCAVFAGPTARAWIGGADLTELGRLDTATAGPFIRSIHEFCTALREFPVPVLAQIRGYCLGAGLEIAAACDLRACDRGAVFGMPEVRVGVPSVIEAALLPQLIGWGRTRELLYRGHLVDSSTALRIGLVEHAEDGAALETAVDTIVDDILSGAPQAMRAQKVLVREWEALSVADAIEAGVAAFRRAYDTDEPARYVEDFFGRRHRTDRD
jgi:enoyl-CoA hydratase